MNREQFNKLVAETAAQTTDLIVRKGGEYANDEEVLANFMGQAKRLGLTPLQTWAVYFGKHIDAIESYNRRVMGVLTTLPKPSVTGALSVRSLAASLSIVDEKLSEPIEGRFHDAINYLHLGLAILKQAREGGFDE